MRTLKLTVEYDGTGYHGWQAQRPGVITIQETMEKAVYETTGEIVRLTAAGRTDAGVHALGQVVSFVTGSSIPLERFPLALNVHLPRSIVVRRAENMPDGFNARYSARDKTYIYNIDNGTIPFVFMRRYSWFLPQRLDVEAMGLAARNMEGNHDFSAFSAAGSSVRDHVRTVTECLVRNRGRWITLKIKANGFLYNMVRIIAGTLVEIGKGKLSPGEIVSLLQDKDRSKAGPTAPPQGLILLKVEY